MTFPLLSSRAVEAEFEKNYIARLVNYATYATYSASTHVEHGNIWATRHRYRLVGLGADYRLFVHHRGIRVCERLVERCERFEWVRVYCKGDHSDGPVSRVVSSRERCVPHAWSQYRLFVCKAAVNLIDHALVYVWSGANRHDDIVGREDRYTRCQSAQRSCVS